MTARVRRVPVVDTLGHLQGIVSKNDVSRRDCLEGRPTMSTLSNVRVWGRGLALMAALVAPAALTAQAPEVRATRPDNYYAASDRVDISSPMAGDVVVAGRTVTIGQPVTGDILAAGWQVTLSAPASDDVRLAGGTVTIDGAVSGDVTVAGGDVTTGGHTHVLGRAWVTGETVRLDGTFDRELQVAGRVVRIGAEVRQPLKVVAEQLEFLPSARILAPVTFRGVAEAKVATGAQLSGPVAFERIEAREARDARAWHAGSTVLFTTHLLLIGLLVVWMVPRFQPAVVEALRAHPGRSLLTGLLLFAAVPAASLVLVVSVLGLPLGVALGMCYLMALFLAVLVTAFVVGDLEARLFKAGPMTTRGQHALLLVAGVLTLAVLRFVLGGVVVMASMFVGLGALSLWLQSLYNTPRTPVAA